MRILVTGISGFIGSALAPELARRGHTVVGFARNPARVPEQAAAACERIAEGDACDEAALAAAMAGCDAFAWLVHSMEAGSQNDFADREAASIAAAVAAADRTGITRAAYLGGIEPAGPPSPHLGSRLAVEQALLDALPEATALRASIVVGAGSRSFRFLTSLVERLPALPLPPWREFSTQPADLRDVIAALVASLEGAAPGRSLDIACPEVVTYGGLIELIADRLLVPRPSIHLPVSLTAVAAPVAAAIAGEDPALITPLMGSLGADVLPRSDGLAELGLHAHSLESAIDRALADLERENEEDL